MPKKNEIFDVNVCDTTVFGTGVAKIDGYVTFTDGAVEGDECSVMIDRTDKNYSFSHPVDFKKLSPYRIDSGCPYFGKCGGCSLRHVSYEYEGILKQRYVVNSLGRCGVPSASVRDILLPSPDKYRNKATFRFDGEGSFGFYEKGSNVLVSIKEHGCRIIPDEFYRTASAVAGCFSEGPEASLTLRISSDGKLLALLDGYSGSPAEISDKLHSLPYDISLFVMNDGSADKIFGEDRITYTVGGICYSVSPTAFFQVNNEGFSLMLGEIGRITDRVEADSIADLYCGTGSLGLYVAKRNGNARVYGIEINRSAVHDAELNARANGILNAEFFSGDAAGFRFSDGKAPDIVIIDPPRAGCSDNAVETVLSLSPNCIIYVSCNPATLSKDLKKFIARGYTVNEATPIDMFPRSEHVETVVLLSRA